MSDSGNFIARWSRLKRRSGASRRQSEPSPESKTGAGIEAMSEAGPEITAAAAATFDLATLPPIESIVAGTDIRPFLQVGVPAELRLVALRGAWAADPTIRDFIGIAENQWNFNDPAGIAGFEPMAEAGVAQGFIGGVSGVLPNAPAAVVAVAALVSPPLDRRFDPPREAHVDQVWLSVPRSAQRADQVSATGRPDVTVRHDPDTHTNRRRGHGSALPK
jgi:hypothetical protein